MTRSVIVDTGPLVALLERRDKHHSWAKSQFAGLRPPLLTCEAVLTETCHLVRGLLDGISTVCELVRRELVTIAFDLEHESVAVAELAARSSNIPMSLADACLVRMAEQHRDSQVLTLDSDFRIYRMHGRKVIPTIMPDSR